MNQSTPKATPATMPKRTQPVIMGPDYKSKRRASGARKRVVNDLKRKREENIRSVEPPRVLSQRIGDLFPELRAL